MALTIMSPKIALRRVLDLLKPSKLLLETSPEPQAYLLGLRGVLTILSLLWTFFETFIPALVSNSTHGPTYQKVLRLVFSPILWNASLIRSFFFALSARSICVRFLRDPKPSAYAGSIIRRIVRLPITMFVACGLAYGIFGGIGTSYIHTFQDVLPNHSISALQVPDSALTGLNAMFDMFWVVRSYYYQAANDFWPSQSVWMVSLIYQQSWTVYFLMIILPYTRTSWHWQFLALFGLGSFWMDSWGWYDASALLLADYVINPALRSRLDEGLVISDEWKIPCVIPGVAMTGIGLAMKYVWTAFPQYIDEELVLHPFLDLSENTSRAAFAAADPYPRIDNWLVIFGILLLMETTVRLRDLLSVEWLVELGRRSLSKSTLSHRHHSTV